MHQSLLNQFNNAELLELDPLCGTIWVSLVKNYRLAAERTVVINVKMDNGKGQQESSNEQLIVKLYVREHKRQLQSLLVDFLSQNDLFFHFRTELGEHEFRLIQEQQELDAQFKELPELLLGLIDDLRKDSSRSAELDTVSDRKAQFILQQRINNKDFNLLSLELYREEEQVVKEMVAYRYNLLRTEIDRMEGRVIDVRTLLKTKNPCLLAIFDQF